MSFRPAPPSAVQPVQVCTATLPALFDLQVDVETNGRTSSFGRSLQGVSRRTTSFGRLRQSFSGNAGTSEQHLNRMPNRRSKFYNNLTKEQKLTNAFQSAVTDKQLQNIFTSSDTYFNFMNTVNARFKSKNDGRAMSWTEMVALEDYWNEFTPPLDE